MKPLQPKELIARVLNIFRYGDRLNASRDWLVLLAVFAVLFVGSIAWNVTFLFETLSRDITSYSQTTTTTTEEDVVETAKRLLEERGRGGGVSEEKTSVVDPLGE